MFSAWLRATRKDRGLSQAGLAGKALDVDAGCKVNQTRVSEYERGACVPSLRQWRAMRAVLCTRVADERAGEELWEAAQLGHDPASAA